MPLLLLIASFILAKPVHANDRLRTVLDCVHALEPAPRSILRPGPQRAVIAAYVDGWAVLAFDHRMSYRCVVPAAIEACFRSNPKCLAFTFFIARPGDGVSVRFNGDAIDDHARTDRLSGMTLLERGTIDEGGRIHRIIRGGVTPILGLRCVADRSPLMLSALERAVEAEMAQRSPESSAACGGVARPGADQPGVAPVETERGPPTNR